LVHIRVKLIFYFSPVQIASSIAQAAWLRCLNGAAFASLKKLPSDFFNSDFVGTEPKEAPYETTGKSIELQELIVEMPYITTFQSLL
jgi:hypothetical protein